MILIFNSPPGTGKDEACEYLQKYDYEHIFFKHNLFKDTQKHFDVSEEWFMDGYDDRLIKETKKEIMLGDRTRREALIHVSEEIIKPKHGNSYYGKLTADYIDTNKDYCVSDGGFLDEINMVINKVGLANVCLVQLTREGCDYSSDSRKFMDGVIVDEFVNNFKTKIDKNHISNGICPIRTYRVHNNGTRGELHDILETIHLKEQHVKKEHSLYRKSV